MKINQEISEANLKRLDQKHVTILGVKVDSTQPVEVLSKMSSFLASRHKFYIVTPNPEIVMLAQKDKKLLKILNSADLSIPDGIGLKFASWFLGQSNLKVIKGRELMLDLILNTKYQIPNIKIFLLGATVQVNKKAVEELKRITSHPPGHGPSGAGSQSPITINGSPGPQLDANANPLTDKDCKIETDTVKKINRFKPHLLFVGFGAPKQEKWIAKWLPKLNIGGAMVVGGALDYIAGRSKLPLSRLNSMGLEWLWRLLTGSQKRNRIKVAIFDFPLKVFCTKLKKSFAAADKKLNF